MGLSSLTDCVPAGAGWRREVLRKAAFALALVIAAGAAYGAGTASAPARPSPPPGPEDVIERAQAAVETAGGIKAVMRVEAYYPWHYTSTVTLSAAQSGDERAESTSTTEAGTYRTVQVKSGGVLWTETQTPSGPLVTKIDVDRVRAALASDKRALPPASILGTGMIADIESLRTLINFTEAREATVDSRKVYAVSGVLKGEHEGALPAGVARFYQRATVYAGTEDYWPWRIELGGTAERPLVRVDFVEVTKNVSFAPGAFAYTAPQGATPVDRTDWAIAELQGR